MGTIIHNPIQYRKSGLEMLGQGCKKCSIRSKCSLDECRRLARYQYQNCTEMMNDYLTFTHELKLETYVRFTKYGYALVVKGEGYLSGEVDERWHIHFYNKDRTNKKYGIGYMDDSYIREKNGKRYLYDKGLKYHYGIGDWIPLEDSKWIMMY